MKKIFLSLLAFNMLNGVFSQRVGINTSTPQETLDVNGNIFLNNKLGINITNPQFPLSFAPSLGDKISLYGNAGVHYGFGIQPYLMQVHTDGSASDIAFGYGHSYSFTETMRIKGNGNVGIGTNNPLAKLHVQDNSVLFAGAYPLPVNPGNPPLEGPGVRMMWYPDKAAFRAGIVNGTQWDKDSIGDHSFAVGLNTKAGYGSIVMGTSSTAYFAGIAIGSGCISSGQCSVAMGQVTTASGKNSVAIGRDLLASGSYSTAIGVMTTASGMGAVAMGLGTVASGSASTAIGWETTASTGYDVAMGYKTRASGGSSTAMGDNTVASGGSSTAIGWQVRAKALGSVSLGSFNDDTDNPDPSIYDPLDRIFQIGNGDGNTRSNAMTVLRNGNVGIGTVSPSQKLHIAAGGVRFEGTPTQGGIALSLGGNGDVQVDAPGVAAGRFVIKDNGKVGIGINTPSQKLHVIGNICATGTISNCSDIRYKQNISPIAHSLSSVLSMNGLYYYWKKNEFPEMEFSNERQIGFSAQEVEKLFPEVVMTDANGYKSVDYGRLTPVLVEAIKEQQKQINAQQQQIDELKKMMEKILK